MSTNPNFNFNDFGAVASAYQERVNTFSLQMRTMFKDIDTNFEKVSHDANKNYAVMREEYFKAYKAMLDAIKISHDDLLKKLKVHFEDLMSNMHTVYHSMKAQANEVFQQSVKDFQTQCDTLLEKFPQLQTKSSTYKDAIKTLTTEHTRNLGVIDRTFNEEILDLEKNYQNALKQMTLPEFKYPKMSPELLPPVPNQQQGQGPSTSTKPSK